MILQRPFLLPETLHLSEEERRRLEADYEACCEQLPPDLRAHCLDNYGVDLAGEYAGQPIANPFGKASGQLALNVRQVQQDVEAGLGFVVLKTVIAVDAAGGQSMAEWAIPETLMRVEPIAGSDGTPGWTVTWKGRGWHESFESYCDFLGASLDAAGTTAPQGSFPTVIAASVKYHLPAPGETEFRRGEYEHTTRALQAVWNARRSGPLPLEKDFSPTLAGDDRSREQEQILLWLRRVPGLVAAAALPLPDGTTPGVALGMKLMNTRFDLDFQVEMLRVLADEAEGPVAFVVYANRLFDPEREFEGKRGVAYGGPDLSRRNLEGLAALWAAVDRGALQRAVPPISATGDVLAGRMAVEYGLLGASSCQMHTLFQLRHTEFGGRMRNLTARVLHHLIFDPGTGLLAALLHLGHERGAPVHWRDLPAVGSAWRRATGGE